jgi:flagellar basal body-associated protein FliL
VEQQASGRQHSMSILLIVLIVVVVLVLLGAFARR